MDGERRRRVAERFAIDDLPCGRAEGNYAVKAVEETLESEERTALPIRTPYTDGDH